MYRYQRAQRAHVIKRHSKTNNYVFAVCQVAGRGMACSCRKNVKEAEIGNDDNSILYVSNNNSIYKCFSLLRLLLKKREV